MLPLCKRLLVMASQIQQNLVRVVLTKSDNIFWENSMLLCATFYIFTKKLSLLLKLAGNIFLLVSTVCKLGLHFVSAC